MKKLSALCLVAIMSFTLVACGSDDKKSTEEETVATVKEMTGEELDKIMEDAKAKEDYMVIDVRSKEEYDAGHVKFAVNESVDTIEKNLSRFEAWKDKNVVTICNTGKKSAAAADILVKNGFKNVYNAQGVKEFKYTTITKVTNVLANELQNMVNEDKYTVVDARDIPDFEAGHLKGAISVRPDDADAKIPTVANDKPVLAYCYTGNKSMVVAEKFSQAGYTVFNSLDGTKEYDKFELVK